MTAKRLAFRHIDTMLLNCVAVGLKRGVCFGVTFGLMEYE